MTRAVLRSDGGARGNPGPAGAGFVIEVDGEVVCRGGRYLGECTNNVAEYEALIWGLENVVALGYREVSAFADSELLVKQINGQYRVKNHGLKPLFMRALALLRGFDGFEVAHVRREQNKLADQLANEAMDQRATVGSPACEPGSDASVPKLF
jgi:ribonuclease HI